MQDVARRARVSVATVSRVINSTTPVSDATAGRVRAAVQALGYEINHVAKSLRQGTTHTVAVIVADLGNPFYADFIKGIELAAQRSRLSVMICTTAPAGEAASRQVQMLLSKRVDGVIMWGWCLEPSQAQRLLASRVRVLGLDLQLDLPEGTRTLSIDFRTGMGDVVAHLTSLGHRNIGYLWDPTDQPLSIDSRYYSLREALASHGLGLPDEWVATVIGGQRPETGQAAALDLLRRSGELTAIVCHNDLLALGALQAARQFGLRVPEQLSIVGIDDIFTAAFTDPPLTTLALPRIEAGTLALGWLMRDSIEGMISPQVTPRLVVRQSTGPAPVLAAES